MDTYPTAHFKYILDSEWDILQALRILVAKLKVPGDAPVSKTIWNPPDGPTRASRKETTDESSLKTWVSNDEDLDTVSSGNINEESS